MYRKGTVIIHQKVDFGSYNIYCIFYAWLKSMLMILCLIWVEKYDSSYALLVYLIVGKRAGCKFLVTIGKESTEFCLI